MREMKDSGVEWIGEIPETWIVERLQWHLDEIKESNSPIKTTQVLSLTNKAGVIPYEDKGEQGNKAKENYDEYKLAYPDTIVANSMNILIGSVGICRYFGCVSPVYYVFKPKENELLSYLNYVFQMEQFQKELRRYANGILEIRLRLSSANIIKRYVAFPSHEEQIAISHFLDRKCTQIDTLISNAQQQIEKLKAYKQSVITETVTKGLDPDVKMKDSGVEWIGEIPEHWGTPQIKHIATISSGSTPNRNNTEYWNGSIKWLKTGELQNNEITDSEEHITQKALEETSVTLFPVNTVLMAMYGQGKTRGMTALLKTPSTTNQACAGMTVVSQNILVKYFWKCLMGAYNGIREIAQGSGQPNLNAGLISSFIIPLPPKEEQQPIIDYLDLKCSQIDKLIALKQQKIEKLQQYKKSLIYEYVTGKKEV